VKAWAFKLEEDSDKDEGNGVVGDGEIEGRRGGVDKSGGCCVVDCGVKYDD
jgi:hypothetical protein